MVIGEVWAAADRFTASPYKGIEIGGTRYGGMTGADARLPVPPAEEVGSMPDSRMASRRVAAERGKGVGSGGSLYGGGGTGRRVEDAPGKGTDIGGTLVDGPGVERRLDGSSGQ